MEKGTPIQNRLHERRKAFGLTQAALAKKIGITRQALYAIESNHYLPSTPIALRLAQALTCQVEDLFSLPPNQAMAQADWLGSGRPGNEPVRVKLTQVGSRLVARPLRELGEVLNFVIPADGIVESTIPQTKKSGRIRVSVRLLNPLEDIQKGMLVAGCDPALFLAGEHIKKIHAAVGVTNWTMGSANALRALQRGEVHMAGVHLVDAKTGGKNLPYLKRYLPGKDFVGVHFASWVQGWLVRPGNPKHIHTVADLMAPGVRLINREPGSGARFFLDHLLRKEGIQADQFQGYTHEVTSHLDLARLIQEGIGDVGIGVEAAARHCGLGFVPLREEQYDLIMSVGLLKSHPSMKKFLDAVVSLPFRHEIEALGGYNLKNIGKTLSWKN